MSPLAVVAFLDGRLGHEKQTRGLIAALARLTPLTVTYNTLPPSSFKTVALDFAVYLVALAKRPAVPAGDQIDLIIGTGTWTHLPMLILKKERGGRVVTCMTPGLLTRGRLDLCLVPQHDRLRPAANIFRTVGPPSPAFCPTSRQAGRGLILVGGLDPKSHRWRSELTMAQIKTVVDRTPALKWTISSSPRTPAAMIGRLADFAGGRAGKVEFYRAADTPAGWIEQQYAANEVVWVTADSVSMIYESLTAGCGVGVLPVDWRQKNNKFQRSLCYLLENRLIVSYEAWLAGQAVPAPGPGLNEAARCAAEILRRWWPERLP